MPGGKKVVGVEVVYVGLKLPAGLHEDMVRQIRGLRNWRDRQEFIAEAIREKLEREKAKGGRLPPGADRVVRETRVS